MSTALMVGAHNEECEYNCGGLAYKLSCQGWRVVFLNLIGDYSNWPMWPEGMIDGQERIDRETVEAAREKVRQVAAHEFALPEDVQRDVAAVYAAAEQELLSD